MIYTSTTKTNTRYNYAGNGRGGEYGNNKGKKYVDYTKEPVITPQIEIKLNSFNDWFDANYQSIKNNLINKNNYNEEVLTDTYLKIYRYILYGGKVNNVQYYFNTSYFTNQFYNTISTNKHNNRFKYIADDELYDSIDEGNSEEQYAAKDKLIIEIENWLNTNVPDLIEREIFVIYINTKYDRKYKMTYERLSHLTGVDVKKIKEIIPRIKKRLQEQFKNKRLKSL